MSARRSPVTLSDPWSISMLDPQASSSSAILWRQSPPMLTLEPTRNMELGTTLRGEQMHSILGRYRALLVGVVVGMGLIAFSKTANGQRSGRAPQSATTAP